MVGIYAFLIEPHLYDRPDRTNGQPGLMGTAHGKAAVPVIQAVLENRSSVLENPRLVFEYGKTVPDF